MRLTEDVAQRVTEAISRPPWKSADPTLFAMLLQKNADQNRKVVRWGIAAAVLSYICYGAFDWFLFPDIADRVILTRLTLGLTFLVLVELVARRDFAVTTLHYVAALAIVAGAIGWLLSALGTKHQEALSHFIIFGTVFILGANLFFNFRLWLSALSSATVTIAFLGATLCLLQADLGTRLVLATYFVNCLVLSLYLSWRLSMERYQTFLHALQAQIQEQVAIENGQKLIEIADTDPLTGLKNRRAITREFAELCKEWARDNDEIGVILMDVDYFKRFNDRLGHQAGDDCLIELARAFDETAASHHAIAGRYGGEEFVVLCKVAGPDHLREVTHQFCRAVEDLNISHPDRDDKLNIVTISAGASLTRADQSIELRILLQEADRALYASKFSGRATFTIYDAQAIDQKRASQNLSELLKQAVSEGLVSVVYQPICDAISGKVLGHESLMRLRDFDGSVISPSVFIPVAEQTGGIEELGMWVIDRACGDMVEHGLGSVVSVNVSVVQLKAPNFPLHVTEILGRHGMAPQRLALEVTEGSDISLEAQAARSIEQLRNLGVQIWLDDFGTGFAGLAWLRRFKFDVVKIDRSFLHDCQTVRGLSLLQDMVRLLRNLGHTVLVEGVETKEQQNLLQHMGIQSIQGFLTGRPVPIEEIMQARQDLVA
ncbi:MULTISPECIES: GGDEF and EAL domain-containing protein [unclassified Mesorhizobium]|uniref:putative bifunctional diguanylate cyclase/phosphodiesterase n=1 Tax=unclassified Mesorhizobium TaxID=325217 RepID=UPI000FE52234|nr:MULTISPECIES: GGDEF and EAL domain-containing protein [unclassified Mesorhizobium]MDG4891072.1 GGDEF and EAL domain-containing protein [Mesorhizobium sp. WSM4887]RWG00904.1 MAG: GGDEF and EAL domain-containing protein [Mesorhizobium sp.]RWG98203.1 MAG: GGDEF and EAL domain-containing protein [Mesorhizobium sp.]TIN44575.1 MAG: GGDEF and EAL domain-containing protein [Mesorhizobium sp.]TIR90075.1 MAG: GGDEF and EAL domain-containing protein [Mesorhizobium sp.]